MARVYFKEEQRFTDSPLIYVFVFSAVAALGGLIYATIDARNTADWEELIFAMTFSLLVLFGLGWLLFSIRLITHVEEHRITYRMPPLMGEKIIRSEDIGKWEVLTYNPVMQYGGWGMRHSFKQGPAYNIRGNKGLRIQLKGGKKLLIGTQKPDMLRQAVTKMMENEEDYG